MYTAFYKLYQKPFQISSDPAFIWLGEKHREALATLKYGVLDNKGLMLLTGDVGTGKTTLINTLIQSLGDDVLYASVPDPRLSLIDLLNYISQAFHIDSGFDSKGSFLLHFGWFLEAAYKQQKKVLLIIDEAQLLTQELLEEIRLLSNINRDGNHLINIFFVGQNEFNEVLARPENRAVTQRITLNYQIGPLSLKETEHYIRHRLKIAGSTRMFFNPSAVKAIHAYSLGIPRRINIICDHCLLTGYVAEKEKIDARIVKDCVKDVGIPGHDMLLQDGTNKDHEAGEPNRAAGSDNTPGQRETRQPNRLLAPFVALLLIIAACLVPIFLAPETFTPAYRQAARYLNGRWQSIQTMLTGSTDQDSRVPKDVVSQTSDGLSMPAAPDSAVTAPEKADQQIPVEPAQREKADVVSEPAASFTRPADQEMSGMDQSDDRAEYFELLPLPESKVVIRFDSNSNDFSSADLERLSRLARTVDKHPEASLDISGYTDSVGAERYNIQLSLFRANMVKSYLMGQGVSPSQLSVYGFGSSNPVADNATEEGRRLNRRVEIKLVGKYGPPSLPMQNGTAR